jgi:hypothetical protein
VLLAVLVSGVSAAQELTALQPQVALPATRTQDSWSADVAREADQSSHAILWRSIGRLSLGLGLQRRAGEWRLGALPERDGSDLLVGLAVRTGPQSRLSFESSPAAWSGAQAPAAGSAPGTLVLQSTDPWRSVRRGVLRMNLDDDSSIGLRLRKRKVMLQYSRTW